MRLRACETKGRLVGGSYFFIFLVDVDSPNWAEEREMGIACSTCAAGTCTAQVPTPSQHEEDVGASERVA